MENENFYEILGIDKKASEKDIKTAFKKLALKYHPDKCKTPEEKERNEIEFKKISAAYDVLSDSNKRLEYDMRGDNSNCFNFQNLFNTFNMFSPLSHINITVEITMEEVYTGTIKTINYNKNILCNTCDGKGHSNLPDSIIKCVYCNGTGYYEQVINMGFMTQIIKGQCGHCQGRGATIAKPCETCNGKLYIQKQTDIKLKIPVGIVDNKTVILKEKGNMIGPNSYTDLIILTKVKPHNVFTRIGEKDLSTILSITLEEALCGFTKNIKHLDGNEIEIKTESIVNPESSIAIDKKGINNGSLYIKFNIIFPTDFASFLKNITELKI